MSKIKVSNLDDTINEAEVSVITKPKRVRPPRIPVKVAAAEPTLIEPPPEPVQLNRPRLTKQPRMTTCVNCGKELLEKTYKYYHQLKCKASIPLGDTVQPETKTKEITKYENTTVDFDYRRSTPQRPVKYASLISRAF
jgi:hypothetical protein